MSYTAFKGLGSDDMIHALLAKDVGCDVLITFDKEFDGIEPQNLIKINLVKLNFSMCKGACPGTIKIKFKME